MSLAMPTDRVGRAFVAAAIFEAFTWTGLLIGMFLEHIVDVTRVGITVFGPLHGAAFIIYGALTLFSAMRFRWETRVTALALLAAVPPLTTIPVERWLRRTGRLEQPVLVQD